MHGQCWIWIDVPSSTGYGHLSIGSRSFILAHRLSWMIHFGDIPDGLLVCHKCDNKICVNPDHLFLGTGVDNMQDAVSKDKVPRGESHSMAVLSDDQVELIREFYVKGSRDFSTYALAKLFGVSQMHISRIVRYKKRRRPSAKSS